jgi:hypothetical protein
LESIHSAVPWPLGFVGLFDEVRTFCTSRRVLDCIRAHPACPSHSFIFSVFPLDEESLFFGTVISGPQACFKYNPTPISPPAATFRVGGTNESRRLPASRLSNLDPTGARSHVSRASRFVWLSARCGLASVLALSLRGLVYDEWTGKGPALLPKSVFMT